ncbi:MAG: hypothetical protein QGH15_22630, partial [Kiritimatiellia bacterium]|nr:hypothetical protein [Kiritimatiellia bacterium]
MAKRGKPFFIAWPSVHRAPHKKRPGNTARPLVCVLSLVKPTKSVAHGPAVLLRLIRVNRR